MVALETLDDFIAIAQEQLDVAIELFLAERSYIASVALAVAAESLFERALKGEETALQWEFNLVDEHERVWPFFGIYDPSLPEKERFKTFREFKRRERDVVNHGPDNHRKAERSAQRAKRPSLRDAAEEAIARACENAGRLGIPASKAVRSYEEWFQENVIGQSLSGTGPSTNFT